MAALPSKKALSGIGGGVLGGAVDLVFAYINGTPIDGNMVFDQLVSGGIQGAIGMTGVGGAILLADAGIQIIGHGAAQLAANNADWLSYGNQARAESIRQTAERFSTALDNLSLIIASMALWALFAAACSKATSWLPWAAWQMKWDGLPWAA